MSLANQFQPTLGRRAFLGLGAASLLTLSACGKHSASSSSSNSSEGTPDANQELNLVLPSDLKTLDVNDIRNANEFLVLSEVQEGLFRTFTGDDGTDDVECAGCESYDVSDDGLTYTFHLRENTWSDGKPVTAQQYVDSILRLVDPANGFSYSFMASDIEGAEAFMDGEGAADAIAVSAPDEKTLTIKLANAVPFFIAKLANLCFCPIRKDLIDANGDGMANDYQKQVYCGPFVISERVNDNSVTLTPNDKYWDKGSVKLQKVTYTIVDEESTQSQLLSSKGLDAVDGTTEYVSQWKKLAEKGQLSYTSKGDGSSNYLAYNMHTGGPSGLMNNVKCRLAISLAFDRDDFNNTIYSGLNTPAYGLIPGGIKSGDDEFRSVAEEPLKAVLDQYGSADKVASLFKEGAAEVKGSDDLSGVNLEILSQQTNTQTKNLTEWLSQKIGGTLGVEVTINAQSETASFVSERNAGNYDFYVMGWNADYSDPLTFFDLFCTGSGYAKYMGGYSNADYDADYASLSTTTDQATRTETYKRLEKNLVQNAGVAPLYYGTRNEFQQAYVKDLSLPQFGTAFEVKVAYISGKSA